MMKKIVLFLFTVVMSSSFAIGQSLPIDPETNKITYQETVSLDSIDATELYRRSKEWIANYLKTDKFEPEDEANSKIGKVASFEIQLTYDYKYKSQNNIGYSLVIAHKDGRYRYTITDFTFYPVKLGAKTTQSLESKLSKMSGQNKSETTTQVIKEIDTLLEDMKRFMITGEEEHKEDW